MKDIHPYRTSRLAAIAAGLLALATFIPVFGQQAATATIEGVVTDQNGAVVANAKVMVKSVETGFTRDISTDASGVYRLPLLPPGHYELTVTASGFGELRRSNLTLTVGQKLNLDLQLKVQGTTETINIVEEAPVVETSRTNVSGSVNARAVSNLPVNGRNFLDFVTLTPGVVRDASRTGDISFGGQRGTFNSIQIDGVDNNNLFFGQALGRTGSGRAPYQFSQDAVQEFQVNTNSFSAEFGRAAGGSINVITKSGTNEFHGTAFEFYRDRSLNAHGLRFDPALGALVPNTTKPPYHFNQFGGNIGGPIKRDRAFFFFDYDGQRNTQPRLISVGALPPAGDTAAQAGFTKLQSQLQNYTRGFNQNVFLFKGDLQLDQANRLSIRYNRQNFTGTNLEAAGATDALSHNGNSLVTTDAFSVALNTAFSPRFLNEFRAQITRDKEPGFANVDDPEATILQGGVTVIVIGRNFTSPRETAERKYQLIDNITYIAGAHSVKAGVDINLEKIKNLFPGGFGAQYTFNSYADFANNKVGRFQQAFGGAGTSGPLTNPNFNEFGFFLQDDWRVRPRLTFNLGLRYDAQVLRQSGVFNPSPALAAANLNTGHVNNDYNNFAPRLGFAWSPKTSDRLVVRGGYGLFYGRTPSIALGTAHSQNGLSVINITLNNPTLPFNYPGRFTDVGQILALGSAATPSLFVFERNYQQPYTQQASFGVEYGLTNNMSVGATYLFVKGTHLQRTRDINLLPPVPTTVQIAGGPVVTFLRQPGAQGNPTRPITGFGRIAEYESNANSNYNALVLQFNKRLSRNFQVLASYTWSKAIDDVPDTTSVVAFSSTDDAKQVQQSFLLRDDRGISVVDIPHRFVVSGLWDLAYFHNQKGAGRVVLDGWQLSSIVQADSNQPFSALLGRTDLNNDTNRETDRAPGLGRNTFRLRAFANVDFRVTKNFFLTEKHRLQFIGEFFNLLNRTNFSIPVVVSDASFTTQFYRVANPGTPTATLTPRVEFGRPREARDARIGQLALKFVF